MKITEYPAVSALAAADVLITDGTNGTKKIAASDALFAMYDAAGLYAAHRTLFRGKNLGTSFTAAQRANIQNGTFKDLWLGDYWAIGGVNYRIMDIDYFLNTGTPKTTAHHLVIMPDNVMATNQRLHATGDNTQLGYKKLEFRSYPAFQTIASQVSAAFGSTLAHAENLSTASSGGRPAAGEWTSVSLELPTTVMMLGQSGEAEYSSEGSSNFGFASNCDRQFALTERAPWFITASNASNYWTRDITDSVTFGFISGDGISGMGFANWNSGGFRPFFCVG